MNKRSKLLKLKISVLLLNQIFQFLVQIICQPLLFMVPIIIDLRHAEVLATTRWPIYTVCALFLQGDYISTYGMSLLCHRIIQWK